MGHGVQPPTLGGPEVGLVVKKGAGVGPTLGCRLGQQVLRDAAQQLLHPLRCAVLCCAAGAITSTCTCKNYQGDWELPKKKLGC